MKVGKVPPLYQTKLQTPHLFSTVMTSSHFHNAFFIAEGKEKRKKNKRLLSGSTVELPQWKLLFIFITALSQKVGDLGHREIGTPLASSCHHSFCGRLCCHSEKQQEF